MSFTVDDATALARAAHAGQLDKAGRPYIEHPLRVMRHLDSDDERMAAVLHDVLEDTAVTADDLRSAGCPEQVVIAVLALTKRPGETPADGIRRVAENAIARAVKRRDLADNSDPRRLSLLPAATAERLRRKYEENVRLLDALSPQVQSDPDR